MKHSATKTRTVKIGTRTKAVLAGGLVLGVGAAVTLAAWNGSTVATADFAAGHFNMQSTIEGATWENNEDGSAQLDFKSASAKGAKDGIARQLSPGSVVYAPFALQLDASTTNAATVGLKTTATGADLAKNLTYTLITAKKLGCDEKSTGTKITAGTQVLGSNIPNIISLTKKETPTYLCLTVTVGENVPQDVAGSVTWTFDAVSTDFAAS